MGPRGLHMRLLGVHFDLQQNLSLPLVMANTSRESVRLLKLLLIITSYPSALGFLSEFAPRNEKLSSAAEHSFGKEQTKCQCDCNQPDVATLNDVQATLEQNPKLERRMWNGSSGTPTGSRIFTQDAGPIACRPCHWSKKGCTISCDMPIA